MMNSHPDKLASKNVDKTDTVSSCTSVSILILELRGYVSTVYSNYFKDNMEKRFLQGKKTFLMFS